MPNTCALVQTIEARRIFLFCHSLFAAQTKSIREEKPVMTRAMRLLSSAPETRRGRACALAALFLVGCGGAGQTAANAPQTPASSAAPAGPAPAPVGAAPSTSAAGGPTPAAPGVTLLPRLPEITFDPKAPLHPLPELKVENIGLHVGGGPNDADNKAPFQHAIATRFPQFLDCYRKNEDPAKGGRFGIDLHIARAGGHPQIEQPRTAMHGADFRACVASVFESVEFEKPKKPTTISYSLHFTLADGP